MMSVLCPGVSRSGHLALHGWSLERNVAPFLLARLTWLLHAGMGMGLAGPWLQ